jgi:predicted small lipoprotein YifL
MRAQKTVAAVIILLLAMLQGCGRKGPLYLQQMPAAPIPSAQKPPEQPLPPAQSAVMQAPTLQKPTDTSKQP